MAIYNNPAMAQIANNLASIFAPPSGSDLAGYANAGATREQAARLAQLFASGASPSEQAALIGVQNFGQTPEGFRFDVNTRSGDNRYGVDVGARTTLEQQRLADEAAMARQMALPILANENQTVFLPGQTQSATGLDGILSGNVNVAPGEVSHLPDGRVIAGPEKPLSETEVLGAILSGMPEELQVARAFGSTPLEQIIMDDGSAQFATRPDAIGQTPAPTGQEGARKDAVAVINGQTIPVTRAPGELVWRTADGQPIPPDAPIYELPRAQGSAEDVGMTGAVTSSVQNRIISTQQTLDTARSLRNMIEQSPSSQGLVGSLRGTAQDIIQTGNDLGQFFGAGIQDVNNAIQNGMADVGLSAEFFDPSIPAIEMMTNLLAWQYAKSLSGERVSNEQLRQAREAIGGTGLFANRANSLARLDELINSWEHQLGQLQTLQPGFGIGGPSGGPSAGPTPPAPPGPPQPPAPPTGGQSTLPSYTDYDSLPSGARFLDPEGNIREKP